MEEGRWTEGGRKSYSLNERAVGQRKDSGTGGWEEKGVTSYTFTSWGRKVRKRDEYDTEANHSL